MWTEVGARVKDVYQHSLPWLQYVRILLSDFLEVAYYQKPTTKNGNQRDEHLIQHFIKGRFI